MGMKFRGGCLLCVFFLLTGCPSQYMKKGLNGGYSDEAIDATSYAIAYEGSPMLPGITTSHRSLKPLWFRRADELCGSSDYYYYLEKTNANNILSATGVPAIRGVAYCNNKFVDTRQQNYDEHYAPYINLPPEALQYQEISPLWDMLMNKQYAELEEMLASLYASENAEDLDVLLDTFGRIDLNAEVHLNEWVAKYPKSSFALYSRSVFYHHYSWFKRGDGRGRDLTSEQRTGLAMYRGLASEDIEASISSNPDFCPAHTLKLGLNVSNSDLDEATYKGLYDAAKQACPKSMGVRKAYLRYLEPRWHGSMEKMRASIEESKKDDQMFEALEAVYLREEGDQFYFAKKYELALQKYNQAIAIYGFSHAYYQRASILAKLERYVEAVESYGEAINLWPYYKSAFEGLNYVMMKQGNFTGALIASSYVTAINGQNADDYLRRAEILYQMRRYDDALASYEKAIELHSNRAYIRHKIRMVEYQIEIRKADELPVKETSI